MYEWKNSKNQDQIQNLTSQTQQELWRLDFEQTEKRCQSAL